MVAKSSLQWHLLLLAAIIGPIKSVWILMLGYEGIGSCSSGVGLVIEYFLCWDLRQVFLWFSISCIFLCQKYHIEILLYVIVWHYVLWRCHHVSHRWPVSNICQEDIEVSLDSCSHLIVPTPTDIYPGWVWAVLFAGIFCPDSSMMLTASLMILRIESCFLSSNWFAWKGSNDTMCSF